jgi:hypothetical protein
MNQAEVESGKVRPYKDTNLRQEVLSMRLPLTQARALVLGNTFIDGAHMVVVGPTRGQLHLLSQNSEVDEQFVLYFAACLCTHIYQFLHKEKHFTCRCCQAILSAYLKPRRDSEQWTLAGIRSHTGPPLFSVFLTKPTYKIWPSPAWLTLPRNSCRK